MGGGGDIWYCGSTDFEAFGNREKRVARDSALQAVLRTDFTIRVKHVWNLRVYHFQVGKKAQVKLLNSGFVL